MKPAAVIAMIPNSGVVPYQPKTWNDAGRAMHHAATLDDAFHGASCLAGGWYRRPVTIWIKVVALDEHYQIAPSEITLDRPWRASYKVEALDRE